MPSRASIKDSDAGTTPVPGEDGAHQGEEGRKASKPSRVTGRSTWQRFKAWFRDNRLFLYVLFFAGSFFLFLLGVLSIWAQPLFGAGLESWFKAIGNYDSYLFFAGLVCIVTAGYLFFALLSKLTEFQRLVSTRSKGDFVHSLDRIERLAFELGTHANEAVADRKREFRIRH